MEKKIFISYSRGDKNTVFAIKSEIEQHIGNQCWIDLNGIESDKEFSDIIISAINNCEIFIFMYSRKSSVSEWTRKELNFAEKKKKRVIFVNIDNSELSDWYLFNYSGRDIISYSKKEEMSKLFRDLKTWCGVSNITEGRKNNSRHPLIFFCVTLCVLLFIGIIFLPINEYGLNNKEGSIIKQSSSDAMLVDLNSIELARTKSGVTNEIIQYQGYSTSYNKDWKIPNWVAYSLDTNKLSGKVCRHRNFELEPLLSDDSVSSSDYTGSGYDRGHMAPAGDMKWSKTAMKNSFSLCNICPQTPMLNSGLWFELENCVREWAKKDTTFVCCGPIVSKYPKFIKNKIAIPDAFFKVICQKRKNDWIGIGFIFSNTNNNLSGSIFDYAKTIDEIEYITGHDFFYNISIKEQAIMESTFNINDWLNDKIKYF